MLKKRDTDKSDFMDEPKTLAAQRVLEHRITLIDEPHIAPLTRFVQRLRERMGPDAKIPYFDPLDGGTGAEVLFLLEAPGPKARNSGFVSRNNPDETAKNFFEISAEAKIERRRTATWNIVPWYIGSVAKIRPARVTDIAEGKESLDELVHLLPRLQAIVLLGRKSQKARSQLKTIAPQVMIFECPHPSPMYVNRKSGNRDKILSKFVEVRVFLDASDHA